jgi:hypothetical protein
MANESSQEEIAMQLAQEFPDKFSRVSDALSRVSVLSLKYSQ